MDLHTQPDFSQEAATKLGLDRPHGAWVDKVHPESPAALGGLRDGDVILKFGGVDIHDLNHLINAVSMTPVGVPADVLIWRDRKEVTVRIMVGDRERTLAGQGPQPVRPAEPADLIRRPERPGPTSSFAMGLELMTLNPQLALRHHIPAGVHGAMIIAIDPESPLATICQVHDVIAKINDQAIQSAEDAVKQINERVEHDPMIISLDRRGNDGMERYTIRVP